MDENSTRHRSVKRRKALPLDGNVEKRDDWSTQTKRLKLSKGDSGGQLTNTCLNGKEQQKADESGVLDEIKEAAMKAFPDGSKTQASSSSSSVCREAALEYLHLWSSQRERWAFRKKTQYWLLQNMYNKRQVPKRAFKVLLLYLEGLQGRQKELAVERAQNFLEKYQAKDNSEGQCEVVSKREYKRAVAVLRAIA